MTRNHPIIALDNHRRPTHYADFRRAKHRWELDVYHTALRNQERRANIIQERQRINALLQHKLYGSRANEVFLAERRKQLAAQMGETLPR